MLWKETFRKGLRIPRKTTTKFFTQSEADQKIGKRIRALVSLPGIPRGTEGTVIAVSETILGNGQYRAVVKWEMPVEPLRYNNQVLAAITGGYDDASLGKPTRYPFSTR